MDADHSRWQGWNLQGMGMRLRRGASTIPDDDRVARWHTPGTRLEHAWHTPGTRLPTTRGEALTLLLCCGYMLLHQQDGLVGMRLHG